MEHSKLIEQLHLREKELIKELSAIRTLMGVYTNDNIILEQKVINEQERSSTSSSNATNPKDNMSWSNYTLYVLRRVGGKAKASRVVERAIEANPTIDAKTTKNAIVAKLSILYRNKKIDAIEVDNKKKGYTYILDANTMIRTT